MVSVFVPTIEELGDRAREIAPDLTEAEALEIGAMARGLMAEFIEVSLKAAGEDPNYGADQPPRDLGEVVAELAEACVREAVERVRRELTPSTEEEGS